MVLKAHLLFPFFNYIISKEANSYLTLKVLFWFLVLSFRNEMLHFLHLYYKCAYIQI